MIAMPAYSLLAHLVQIHIITGALTPRLALLSLLAALRLVSPEPHLRDALLARTQLVRLVLKLARATTTGALTTRIACPLPTIVARHLTSLPRHRVPVAQVAQSLTPVYFLDSLLALRSTLPSPRVSHLQWL